MILFIIGALFVLIALAILIFSDDAKRTAIIPAVVAVIFIGISCVSYVPTGYTGIVTTFGKVEDGTKDAGVVFKAPWQSIVKMDNRVQEMSMDLSAFSSDIQEVSTSVAVGYRINQANAMTIYKEVGKKYEDTLITPRVLETVKAVVAHYDASSLISNRDAVASQMDTKLREVLAQYNIDLQYISVTNFDFTDTFTDAVEAKDGKLHILGTEASGGDTLTADCILIEDVTMKASMDETVAVYLAGCFNPDKLTVKDSYTMTEADKDALRMRDIVLLPVVEM